MEIKKDSWHYFVWSMSYKLFYRDISEHTNLCRYFWRIVLFTIFLLPVYTLRKLLSVERKKIITTDIFYDKPITYYGDYLIKNHVQFVVMIGLLWAIFLSIPFVFSFAWLVKTYLMFLLLVAISIVMLAAIAGIVFLREYLKDKDREKINIIKEYIKAKKNKICPIINFEE